MDKELFHICEEIGVSRPSRKALVEEGVVTCATLLEAKEKLRLNQFCSVKQEGIQSKLSFAASWFQMLLEKNGKEANILVEFTDSVFEKFNEDIRAEEKLINHYINDVLGSNYCEKHKPLFDQVDGNTDLVKRLVGDCVQHIMTPYLKKECGKFNYEEFLEKSIEHFHHLVSCVEDKERKTFVVAGKTQSGKSSVKGVVQSLCGLLKIPVIVITKGVSESRELHSKLKRLAEGTSIDKEHVVCASSQDHGRTVKQHLLDKATEGVYHGGTFIIADTEHQVNKAIKTIEKYRNKGQKFVVAVDECDAMNRTPDNHQKFEQAYERLMDMNPSLIIQISATIIPTILDVVDEKADIEFFNLESRDDYNGLERFQHLVVDGNKVYLRQNELSVKSEYVHKEILMPSFKKNSIAEVKELIIPYMNEKVKDLYDDALSSRLKRKGVLVLDCSCPRVNADGNVFEKAEGVQEMYRQEGKAIAVIVYVGRGIKVRMPHDHEWNDMKKTHRRSN